MLLLFLYFAGTKLVKMILHVFITGWRAGWWMKMEKTTVRMSAFPTTRYCIVTVSYSWALDYPSRNPPKRGLLIQEKTMPKLIFTVYKRRPSAVFLHVTELDMPSG